MTLAELIARTPNFDTSSHYDKIRLFAWHLHAQQNIEIFDNSLIRDCYRTVHTPVPNLSVYLSRMAAKRPAHLLRSRAGYQLTGSLRRELDAKYGAAASTIAVTQLLLDLPARVANIAEKVFLSETLDCYRVGAFRAAIVMSWNLAFDHLTNWIMADAARLIAFNSAITARFPKRGAPISKTDDFAEFKESEVVEISQTAGLISRNTAQILREKLRRRNMAAHPSNVKFTQPQADDAITDLVHNVVLALT
jgi:hypothetical protein